MTTEKKSKPKKYRTKSITKAKLLFMYIIGAGIVSFIYAISCLFTGLSFWYAALPYSLLIIYGIAVFIWKNWKMIWVFIQNVERGRLLMFLNNSTHFEYAHKMKVIEWVYPRSGSIRKEARMKLNNKIMEGKELTLEEKILMRKQVVACPQQLFDGFNKTMLVNALIWAHTRIQVLDDEIREIMELTDENIEAFDIYKEIAKIKEPCLN